VKNPRVKNRAVPAIGEHQPAPARTMPPASPIETQLKQIILKALNEAIESNDEPIGPDTPVRQLVERLRPLPDLVVEKVAERLCADGLAVPSDLAAIVEEIGCPPLSDETPVSLLALRYQQRRRLRIELALRAQFELERRRLDNPGLGAQRISQTSLGPRYIVRS
jgi:hypothetical protein